jgi:hypothetical protein
VKALCELEKALKTVFLYDYLRLESLRREIHEGLEVIENWSSANEFILYGKGGEFASNRLEDQEILMLSLHLLQVSLVYGEHAHDSGGAGRTGMARPSDGARPKGTVTAEVAARPSIRNIHAEHPRTDSAGQAAAAAATLPKFGPSLG